MEITAPALSKGIYRILKEKSLPDVFFKQKAQNLYNPRGYVIGACHRVLHSRPREGGWEETLKAVACGVIGIRSRGSCSRGWRKLGGCWPGTRLATQQKEKGSPGQGCTSASAVQGGPVLPAYCSQETPLSLEQHGSTPSPHPQKVLDKPRLLVDIQVGFGPNWTIGRRDQSSWMVAQAAACRAAQGRMPPPKRKMANARASWRAMETAETWQQSVYPNGQRGYLG